MRIGPDQFIGLPIASPDEADVLFLPVPYERTVTYGKGTSGAPHRILVASDQLETFDEITEIDLEDRLRQFTAEPAPVDPNLPPEEYLDGLASHVRQAPAAPLMIGIGGEHTVTYGLAEGRLGTLADATFVWIDAHADLADELEGRRWSHGTVARRIVDEGAKMILIGVRSLSRSEFEFIADTPQVDVYFAHRLEKEWPSLLHQLGGLFGDVYLSVDVDGLDPSVIPSTGAPQPDGLSWRQASEIFDAIFSAPRATVQAADLVEFVPSPHPPGCDLAAAKLLFRMVCAWLANRP